MAINKKRRCSAFVFVHMYIASQRKCVSTYFWPVRLRAW